MDKNLEQNLFGSDNEDSPTPVPSPTASEDRIPLPVLERSDTFHLESAPALGPQRSSSIRSRSASRTSLLGSQSGSQRLSKKRSSTTSLSAVKRRSSQRLSATLDSEGEEEVLDDVRSSPEVVPSGGSIVDLASEDKLLEDHSEPMEATSTEEPMDTKEEEKTTSISEDLLPVVVPPSPLPAVLSPIRSVEPAPVPDSTEEELSDVVEEPAGPPPIEIVFSFDTTGSMSSCLDEVRGKMQHIIERLFMDIPSLKISVIAHGDYCDATHFYVTQKVDFTNDIRTLCEFVKNVGGTGGGDWEECYELVLRETQELSWSPGTRRVLVMLGDAIPHGPGYALNTNSLDWQVEAHTLANMGVRIYGVQCQNDKRATSFYQKLSAIGQGRYIKLDQFSSVIHMMMAICYREHGTEHLQAYEHEVRANEGPGLSSGLSDMFDALRGGDTSTHTLKVPPTKAKKRVTFKAGAARRPTKGPSTAGRVGLKTKTKVTALSPKARKLVAVAKAKKSSNTDDDVTVAKLRGKKPAKLSREQVPETKFTPNKVLNWSPWYLAMVPQVPKDPRNKDGWSPRRQGHLGFRKISLFRHDTRQQAFYEMAVQTSTGCKKYVTYARASDGFTDKVYWDTYLLRHRNVIAQVDDVLRQGCKIFIRRACIPKRFRRKLEGQSLTCVDDVKNFVVHRYDYAWNKNWFGKQKHRLVSKRGIVISNNTI